IRKQGFLRHATDVPLVGSGLRRELLKTGGQAHRRLADTPRTDPGPRPAVAFAIQACDFALPVARARKGIDPVRATRGAVLRGMRPGALNSPLPPTRVMKRRGRGCPWPVPSRMWR